MRKVECKTGAKEGPPYRMFCQRIDRSLRSSRVNRVFKSRVVSRHGSDRIRRCFQNLRSVNDPAGERKHLNRFHGDHVTTMQKRPDAEMK